MSSDALSKLAQGGAAPQERPIDGWKRPPDLEERINDACRTALNGPAGDLVMDYIKSITLNAVMPASASDAELRDMEGMRRLCGILDTRRKSTPRKG